MGVVGLQKRGGHQGKYGIGSITGMNIMVTSVKE
jgi:hypothetical protein